MGRGARQAAYNQQTANQQQLFGQLQGIAGSIPSDLTPQQRSAVTQAALGGVDTQMRNTEEEAMRRASATGSQAGLPEMLLETGREGARAKGQLGAQLQEYFAEVPVQRALARAGVYLPMFGTTTQAMGQVAPQPSNFLNSIIGAGGAIGGGLLGGICWVADELYGPLSGQAMVLRFWMLRSPRTWRWQLFRSMYARAGRFLARKAHTNQYLRAVLKSIFDRALSTARHEIGIDGD